MFSKFDSVGARSKRLHDICLQRIFRYLGLPRGIEERTVMVGNGSLN